MTEVSFVDLVVRMVVSLGVVLGFVLGAYMLLRRRQGFAPGPRSLKRGRSLGGSSSGRSSGGSSKTMGNRRGLRVLGRVGVGRTTQIVAVQFAEKVLLVGASDTSAPSVLAELDLASWIEATETFDMDGLHLSGKDAAMVREAIDPTGVPSRPGILDSLREVTSRRG